jgi:hypothetical protein
MSSAPVYLATLARLLQDGHASPCVAGIATGSSEAAVKSMVGAMIAHKQAQSQWGDKLIAQLFGQQPVDQMPWGHNIQIFTKFRSWIRPHCEQLQQRGADVGKGQSGRQATGGEKDKDG